MAGLINHAQLLMSFCCEIVWSLSQSVPHEGKTIKKWSKMKVIFDGVVKAWDLRRCFGNKCSRTLGEERSRSRVRWEQVFPRLGRRGKGGQG